MPSQILNSRLYARKCLFYRPHVWCWLQLHLGAIYSRVLIDVHIVADVPDPCRGVTCGPGELCRPTADGKGQNCECPSSCPSYGDHEGSRALCASDAKDYPGICEMRRAACETNNNITFKYYGKCDPCAGVTCPDPEVCQLDEQREPSCRCAESCPLEFSPVCASDGKTYSNECQMHRESCRARKQLKIIFKGQCSSGVNPCAEVECRHGAECRVEGSGAVCACPPPCEPVLRPVCGSDARTHDSECELKRAGCLLGRELNVVHAGACGSNGVCAGRVCPHGGECVSSGGRGVCRCPRCSNEFAPVCGSDGISYGNRCKLQLEACRHRRHVQVLYDGPCNGCENKKCEFYAVCESDGVSEASCVCPKHCEEGTETEEICGNDNKTYSSVCALRDVACREKTGLHVKHMGSCESCGGIQCPSGMWCSRGKCACAATCADAPKEPVCADNRRTFPNECSLQRAACEARMRGETAPQVSYFGECTGIHDNNDTAGLNKSAKILDQGNDIRTLDDVEGSTEPTTGTAVCARVQCAYEATCAVDGNGQPRCACLFDCAAAAAAASAPVCASDLRMYPTLCHMKLEACRRQEDLRLRPLALCRGLEFRPCGDDEPLTDAGGRPMDCGGGPHRKDCPAGSYCHHTAKAARCCRKACGCSAFGSVREDCEQMTGRCVCKSGIQGQKCTICSNHEHTLGPNGCFDPESTQLPATDCEHMTCYFGAYCVIRSGLATCECGAPECAANETPSVCGSDGRTYLSACHLRSHACRSQSDIVVQAFGPCVGDTPTVRRGSRSANARSNPTRNPKDNNNSVGQFERTYQTNYIQFTDASVDTSDSGKPDSPEPELTCIDILPPIERVHKTSKKIEGGSGCNKNIPKHVDIENETEEEQYITNEVEENYPIYEEYVEENENEVYETPLFDGQARIIARAMLPSKRFDIWAEVSAVCGKGALISASGVRDYLWLGFVDDRAALRWDAGNGPLDLRSGKLKLDVKSKISARRYKKDAMLKLGSTTVRGSTHGRMSSLDVDPYIYVGHPPENVTKLSGTHALHGFVGCVHRLRVSGRDVIPPSRGLSITAHGVRPCTPYNLAQIVCP
ncbi:jg15379 [Pararge aegeria aegeria]|uniref:Jg15379 protein n=1 Tax=Pararge aegeria aegeria TaxID=348720 RepID=A0A8S4S669_9NEOP|nr:jg15379 [Pararge aegeria aegeria]